jgi:uncharacterized membrane protein YeaQ/YmgE (transglycosylase-associated protein family)
MTATGDGGMLAFNHAALLLAQAGRQGLLASLLIGCLAGWLAGQITRRRGFGLVRNLIIGILGSILGSLLFSILGLEAYGFIGQLVMATFGALALLYLINVVTQRR